MNGWTQDGSKQELMINPSEEEGLRPEFWRFWKDIPFDGTMKIFLHAWTSDPILKRTRQIISLQDFDEKIKKVNAFEKTLSDNGALVVKFYLNLDHKKQRERLIKLSSDELLSWKIKASDWEHLELYDQYVEASRKMIKQSSNIEWNMIDGSDVKGRSLHVAEVLIHKIKERLNQEANKSKDRNISNKRLCPKTKHLDSVDLSLALEKQDYKQKLKQLQSEISKLQQIAFKNKIPSILVMEGWDAAGKGGAVRRLTQALDSRQYEVIPIAAPSPEELSNHYLWRFWTKIPSAGRIAVFDRSWYGRVLVERIEGFATEEEWMRAYKEINDFESQLVDFGAVLCKFWIHISSEEQLGRFKDREHTPHKSWKLNDEDWRNRDKWDEYVDAAEDMFELTQTPVPWTIVPGNQKHYSRIKILETFANALRERLSDYL